MISLSDRLKPWAVIADRVAKAAAADLVLAFYNPASRTRTWQLAAVRDLLLEHRDPETPVVLGRAVGRAGEQLTVTSPGQAGPGPGGHVHAGHRRVQRRPGCTTGRAARSCSRPGTTARTRRTRRGPVRVV